ncbi:MAG: NAD-dependent epimerase/dehydratase family protein [Candidatus Helarchaeota archaeon]|nr:NAD-dependent epimerase/dehydratase family protein [Candidatus Helarchaeota archaeon]
MRVAVTGICSGLGKALLPKLQMDPSVSEIIGIDVVEFEGNTEKVNFLKIDVRDAGAIERALKGVDVLIHLAYIVIPKKLPKLRVIYDINVNGSKTVFKAAAKNNVKKIMYISSQAVYGHVKECPKIVTEESPRLGIKTMNFYYSHTKALVEKYLDELEETYPDIAVVRFRPPIIAGANFIENLGLISPKKGKNMLFPQIAGEGLGLQLVHEDDLTNAIMIALKRDVHGAYNVASNILPGLIEFFEQEFGTKVRRIPIPRVLVKLAIGLGRIWTKLSWLQAILYHSSLNTEKIEKELNWKPKYSTEDCLRELYQGN